MDVLMPINTLLDNSMVFMKMSHGMQKCHKCHFLKYKEGQLELVFEGKFANYFKFWMCLQNASSMCK
jgi:hypothetical protein